MNALDFRFRVIMTWVEKNSWRPDFAHLFLQNVISAFHYPTLDVALRTQDINTIYLTYSHHPLIQKAQQRYPVLKLLLNEKVFEQRKMEYEQARDALFNTIYDQGFLPPLRQLSYSWGYKQIVEFCTLLSSKSQDAYTTAYAVEIIIRLWTMLYKSHLLLMAAAQDVYALSILLSQTFPTVTLTYVGQLHLRNYQPVLQQVGGKMVLETIGDESCVEVGPLLKRLCADEEKQ